MDKLFVVYQRTHHTRESIYHTGEKTFTSERVSCACTNHKLGAALGKEKMAQEGWNGYSVYEVNYIPGRKPASEVYIIEGDYKPLGACALESDAKELTPIYQMRYGGLISRYYIKKVQLLAAKKAEGA